MESTPDTPGGFGRAFHDASFQRRNLRARSIEEQLDLFLNTSDL